MNRTKLKTYAPQARRDFITAVTDRAAYYGLTRDCIETMTEQGDVVIIAGTSLPRHVAAKRKRLEERITRQGFEQTMEAIAYTWFNRFAAIRFMELHGYLDHGYRVLSHPDPDKPTPEILEHAEHVDLPGLNQTTVIDLKLDGTREAELYRMLLIAQCNALHVAMPFLFERIDDETELLLPDNLLHSDSLIRKLVNGIDEEDWQEVEIIGWLYQFYISEKKDHVIGKVVKSEDIPAATQLFTPNWIVKYLVQNSLGRQWMATYPNSTLKQQMAYYIEPAEQTPEVQAQLKAITPESLNPEELTLLDPACGSGHILVEAYDLFKAIYQERGYRARDISSLILQKNLFGLEIDDRATQLAAFALMMKARADDRRIFSSGIQPHVMSIQESKGLNAQQITEALNVPILKTEPLPCEYRFEELEEERAPLFSRKNLLVKGDIAQADVAQLIALFEYGKTFGSLIRVPKELAEKLPAIAERVQDVLAYGGMLEQAAAKSLGSFIEQSQNLAQQYNCVVTNPPYMGIKFYALNLKAFVRREYKRSQGDLYTCFMIRNLDLAQSSGLVGMITIPNWMFLSSFNELRDDMLGRGTIDTFIHNGRGVFGSDFGSCSFIVRNHCNDLFSSSYRRLFEKQGSVADNEELEQRFFTAATYIARQSDFRSIPGQPIAYWTSECMRQCFQDGTRLGDIAEPRQGLATTDNKMYLRLWPEINFNAIKFRVLNRDEAFESGAKWFPYNKGGEFRRWYGNNEWVINWQNDGEEIKQSVVTKYPYLNGKYEFVVKNQSYYFRPALTWTDISSSFFGVRCSDPGFLFDVSGSSAFPPEEWHEYIAGFLASKIASSMLAVLNPTMHFQVGNIAALPVLQPQLLARKSAIDAVVREAVQLARTDWDSLETSWDFQTLPVLQQKAATFSQSQAAADTEALGRFQRMKQLEEENNHLFIDAYGLQDELSPEVSDDQITLYRPNREEEIKRLISYAIGCMMGRYSLDKPGLIYAHSGNQGFDPSQYQTFPADEDGIIPVMETDWFPDDASNRLVEFISVAWPKEHLEENLTFIADSLGPNRNEQPRDTIRRYLATGFYKHHLSRCTSAAPSTGSFPAANNGPSSVSSICTATTKAPCHACAPSTSFRCRGRSPHASTNWPTTLLRPARPRIARGWRRNGTHSASSTQNCRPLTSSSATMPTSVSASTWMTG